MNVSVRKILTLIGGIGLYAISASAIYAQSTSTTTIYHLQLQEIINQTGPSTTVTGYSPLSYKQWALVAQIDTNGVPLSAAPYVTNSSGATIFTFPADPDWPDLNSSGSLYYRYQAALNKNDLDGLNSAVGTGPFTFWLGDATAQPTLSIDTTNAGLLPVTPMVTSGGTWSGNALQIDADTGATLTVNSSSFSGYNSSSGLGGVVSVGLYNATAYPTPLGFSVSTINVPSLVALFGPGVGQTTPLSTYVIAPGELTAGQTYILQVNFQSIADINTTQFSGTGISGNPPVGWSFYNSSTFITVDAVPLPAGAWLMLSGLVGFGTIVRKHRTG